MRELNQGEEYDEDDYDGEEFGESDEVTNAQISTIFGIPKLYFFIGLAVLVIVILLLVLFLFRGKKNDTEMSDEVSDILASSEIGDDEEGYSWSPEDGDITGDTDDTLAL